MAVEISQVLTGSLAAQKGILPGDRLLSIGENQINDVLDYRFYLTDSRIVLCLERDGEPYEVVLVKEEYDDIGLEFESYLMDRQHHCTNKCIFCFVDQMPDGMRDTLYFKDDDSRMSFFFGNYVTLTNMSQEEIDRIIKMHISPINVSVHTTDPALRVEMMKNPKAASSLRYLRQLADAGIRLNTQLVLCPGVNDGPHLQRSLRDLASHLPALQSIACVPVGLTEHREGLYPIRPYTREEARQVVEQVERFGQQMLELTGDRLAYAADEFYQLAELPLPGFDYYGEFPQLENGVGVVAMLRKEFEDALELTPGEEMEREISIATGTAAAALMEALSRKAMDQFPGLRVKVYPIRNDFFGHTITVAGLITGTDLKRQLAERELGSSLLIPATVLRHERDAFLDDVTLEELSRFLGVPIEVVDTDGFALLDAMTGITG